MSDQLPATPPKAALATQPTVATADFVHGRRVTGRLSDAEVMHIDLGRTQRLANARTDQEYAIDTAVAKALTAGGDWQWREYLRAATMPRYYARGVDLMHIAVPFGQFRRSVMRLIADMDIRPEDVVIHPYSKTRAEVRVSEVAYPHVRRRLELLCDLRGPQLLAGPNAPDALPDIDPEPAGGVLYQYDPSLRRTPRSPTATSGEEAQVHYLPYKRRYPAHEINGDVVRALFGDGAWELKQPKLRHLWQDAERRRTIALEPIGISPVACEKAVRRIFQYLEVPDATLNVEWADANHVTVAIPERHYNKRRQQMTDMHLRMNRAEGLPDPQYIAPAVPAAKVSEPEPVQHPVPVPESMPIADVRAVDFPAHRTVGGGDPRTGKATLHSARSFREFVRNVKVMRALFREDTWDEVHEGFRDDYGCVVDLAPLAMGMTDFRNHVERIFAMMDISPHQIKIAPTTGSHVEVAIPAHLFYEKHEHMNELAARVEAYDSSHGRGR